MRHRGEALPKRMLIDGKLTDSAALAGERSCRRTT